MCRLLSGALIAFLLLGPTSSYRVVVNSNAFSSERGRSNGTSAGVINSSEGLDLVAQPAASDAVGPKSSNVAKTAESRMHRVGRKCFDQHAHSVNATNDRVPFDLRDLFSGGTPPERRRIIIDDTMILPSGGAYIKFVSLAPFTVHLGAADGWIGFPCGWSNDLSYSEHHTVAFGGGKMSVTVSAAFKYDWVHETGVLGLQYVGSAATKALFSAAISALYHTPFLTAHAAAHLASAGIAGTAVFSICPWCGLVVGIIMLGLTVTNIAIVDHWATNLLYSTGFFHMSNLLRQHVNNAKRFGEELEETWSLVGERGGELVARMEELKLMKLETLSEIFGDERFKLTYVKEAFDQATNFRENRSNIYMSVEVVEQFLKEMHTWGNYQETVWSSPTSNLTKTLYICGGFGDPIETNAYLVKTGQEMIRQRRPRSSTPEQVRSSGADTAAERLTRPYTPRRRPEASQLPGGGNVQPRARNPVPGEPTRILHVWSYFPLALRETEDECACVARMRPAVVSL